MSLKSSILAGFAAGTVGLGGALGMWMQTEEQQMQHLGDVESGLHSLSGDSHEDLALKQQLYRKLVAGWTRLRGATNSHTLDLRGYLARTYAEDKKYALAEAEYRSLIEVEEGLGPSAGITDRYALADLFRRTGRLVEEEKQLRVLVALVDKSSDPPRISSAKEELIENLDAQEKYDEERGFLLEGLAIISPLADKQRAIHGNRPVWKGTDYRQQEAIYLRRVNLVSRKEQLKMRWMELNEKYGPNDSNTTAGEIEYRRLKDAKIKGLEDMNPW